MASFELPKPGEMLGKYTIVRMLGEGGMGCVFEAIHKTLDQRVAIKVLKAPPRRGGGGGGLDAGDVARFEREARLAARLKTSHAVRIFDVDVTTSGLPYIVMELIDGHDLADELRENKNRIPTSDVVRWAIEICEALSEAHALGVVHRDIKSSNILLVREGKTTIAKLVDFGIAKPFATNGGELDTPDGPTTLTATGAWVGTPAYMAPEQFGIRGEGSDEGVAGVVDARTDVWALGVTLYRVLGGRFPFEGGDGASIIEAIKRRAPTSLSEIEPSIPGDLSKVVMKALRKDPEERHLSAEAFADALRPFASLPTSTSRIDDEHAVTHTAPSAMTPRTTKPANHRWMFALGLLVVGATATVFAWPRASTPVVITTSPPASTPSAVAEVVVPPPPPTNVEDAAAITTSSAKPPTTTVAGPKKPNCVCEGVSTVSGGNKRLVAACTAPMTPRCMCKQRDGAELCPTPWTHDATTNRVNCADEWGFGGVGKKTSDGCSGQSFKWAGDVLTAEIQDGKLFCQDCYGPPHTQAAVPNTPCRSYVGSGQWHDGTWSCAPTN